MLSNCIAVDRLIFFQQVPLTFVLIPNKLMTDSVLDEGEGGGVAGENAREGEEEHLEDSLAVWEGQEGEDMDLLMVHVPGSGIITSHSPATSPKVSSETGLHKE